jgi:hypothetical protein
LARKQRLPRRCRSRAVHRNGRHRVDRRLPSHADYGLRIRSAGDGPASVHRHHGWEHRRCAARQRGAAKHRGKGFANSATRKVAPSRSKGDSPGATDERLSNWTRHAGRERRPVYNGVLTRGREKEDVGPGRLREIKAGITARLAAGEVDSARRGVGQGETITARSSDAILNLVA